MHGLPVICFEGATGFAEVLQREKTTGLTVMPHLDTDAAARLIVEFAEDNKLRQRVGEATRALARATFDMDHYVASLDEIGSQAIELMRQRRADFDTLLTDPSFDTSMSLPAEGPIMTRDAAILRFLAYWSAARTAPHQVDHLDIRRPCAGFNPQIYAQPIPELMRPTSTRSPISSAKDTRRGHGSTPSYGLSSRSRADEKPSERLPHRYSRAFLLPRTIADFLAKLAINNARCDLLLSTNNEAKAEALRAATLGFNRGEVEIRVVPNRGRDIGPVLSSLWPQNHTAIRHRGPFSWQAQHSGASNPGGDLARIPLAAPSR